MSIQEYNVIKSHDIFFEQITLSELNAFLLFSDVNYGNLLQPIINTILNKNNMECEINVENNKNKISIYINIFKVNSDIKISHITLHLYKYTKTNLDKTASQKRYNTRNGRLHVKNNMRKNCCAIRIEYNTTLRFHLSHQPSILRKNTKEYIEQILKLIENMFNDKSSEYILDILPENLQNQTHPFLQQIQNSLYPKRIRNTRKVSKYNIK